MEFNHATGIGKLAAERRAAAEEVRGFEVDMIGKVC